MRTRENSRVEEGAGARPKAWNQPKKAKIALLAEHREGNTRRLSRAVDEHARKRPGLNRERVRNQSSVPIGDVVSHAEAVSSAITARRQGYESQTRRQKYR